MKRWMTIEGALFRHIEIKYFPTEKKAEAVAFLKQP